VRNLLIAKNTRIDVLTLSEDGLVPVMEIPIYGRIEVMRLFRSPGEERDHLFLLTSKYKFCILKHNPLTGEIDTVASGDAHDRIGRPIDSALKGIIDPHTRCIGFHLYERLFKIVSTDYKKEAFNIRLNETIRDVVFLDGPASAPPTLAVLYTEPTDVEAVCHIKTFAVSLAEKDVAEGPWSMDHLESSASKLVPVPMPLGGVVVVAEQTLTYFSRDGLHKAIPMEARIVWAVAKIDENGSRMLLSDHMGRLLMLVLENDGKVVTGLKMENLGVTSIASDMSYLDNGYVFVGSAFGDSQLIKLRAERHPETGHYLEVIDTYPNLGPIVDFCVVDFERQGQGQLVTCSGAFKDGSLRVIRNGISIAEMASVELQGIKEIFSVKRLSTDRFHSYLIQSFSTETRVLELVGAEEMVEASLPGLNADMPTLFAGNVVGDLFVQITAQSARLIDCTTMLAVNEWSPPAGYRIAVGSGNMRQVMLATTGGNLIYLEIEPAEKKLVEKGHTKLDFEISCLSVSPLGSDPAAMADICSVGMWGEVSVRIIALPSLQTLRIEPLGGDTIARSTLLVTLEGTHYLLVALGDGHIFTYKISKTVDPTQLLSDRRQISIGTQPAALNVFYSRGTAHVFAACDRPTVIYAASGGGKLLCSNVNLREVTRVAGFDSEAFPDCLALATEDLLVIGAVDDIQKLHIRSIPLGEQPHRIAHFESAHVFAVLTSALTHDDQDDEISVYSVKLIDESTFDVMNVFKLDHNESGCSVACLSFAGDSSVTDTSTYFVVGTAYTIPDEDEPTQGRILVFSVTEGRLDLVAEKEVKGSVYCLTPSNGKLLAGVNSKVQLFRWSESEDGSKSLTEECSYHGHVIVLHMRVRGDFILVADVMRSVCLLVYKPMGGTIEEIARDYDCNWMTAIEMLDDDKFIGTENSFNLFTVGRNPDASSEEERTRLEKHGEFHLGEFVNRISPGSLVMQMPESESIASQTLVFGCVSGMIGVIATLPPDTYEFFLQVQKAMTQVVKGVGGFKHEEWRQFSNARRSSDARGVLDGDLIERFLDLRKDKMEEVAVIVDVSVDELSKKVEELVRLH